MRGRVWSPWILSLALLAAGEASASAAGAAVSWDRSFSFGGSADSAEPALPGQAAPMALFDGRVALSVRGCAADEAAAQTEDLAARLAPLFASGPWVEPFSPGRPLRIVIAATDDNPASRVRAAGDGGEASPGPRIEIFTGGRGAEEIGEEALRGAALLALTSWAPEAPAAFAAAAARAVALGADLTDSDREEIRESAATPEGSLEQPGQEILGACWIRELMLAAGPTFLPAVWKSAARQPDPYAELARAFREETGGSASEAFARALRRAYSTVEVLPDFSRLTEQDLAAGALNASEPGFLAWRHFSTEPRRGGGEELSWPEDGARGFAVIHYDDALPVDLVEFRPGQEKSLPFNGVARIDWIIWGEEAPASALAAPVTVSLQDPFPVTGLTARAESVPKDGVRLEWATASHRDLIGWAILRRQVDASGDVVMSPPEWLPARIQDPAGSSYDFIDASTAAGHFYRYDVWAVTTEGVLSRCFRVTLRAR